MERPGAGLGIAASGAVLVLTALPYALGSPPAVVGYYGDPLLGPPLVALFALVAAIAVLAGTRRRTDPATAAGIALAVGAFAAAIAWWWALGVDPSTAAGVSATEPFRHHRWALAIAAGLVPLGAAAYARAVV